MMDILALILAMLSYSMGCSCILQTYNDQNNIKLYLLYITAAIICFAVASVSINSVWISIQ